MANETQSNNKSSPQSPPPGYEPPPTSNSVKLTVAAIIIVLAGGLAYFGYSYFKLKEEREYLLDNKEQLEFEIEDLEIRMEQLDADLQDSELALEEKDQRLQNVTTDLAAAQARIARLSREGALTQEQLDKYKFQLEQMEYYVRRYQNEINELKAENQRLSNQNQQLSEDIRERDSVNTRLNQERTLLTTRLDAASILKARNFRYISINRRGKEREDDSGEIRASRTERLRICFTLLSNEVAETGNRPVYLTIKAPDGSVLKSFETSSGYFTLNGQEVPYTIRSTINYQRTDTQVCMEYPAPPSAEFAKGRYIITAYSDGFKIGESTMTMN